MDERFNKIRLPGEEHWNLIDVSNVTSFKDLYSKIASSPWCPYSDFRLVFEDTDGEKVFLDESTYELKKKKFHLLENTSRGPHTIWRTGVPVIKNHPWKIVVGLLVLAFALIVTITLQRAKLVELEQNNDEFQKIRNQFIGGNNFPPGEALKRVQSLVNMSILLKTFDHITTQEQINNEKKVYEKYGNEGEEIGIIFDRMQKILNLSESLNLETQKNHKLQKEISSLTVSLSNTEENLRTEKRKIKEREEYNKRKEDELESNIQSLRNLSSNAFIGGTLKVITDDRVRIFSGTQNTLNLTATTEHTFDTSFEWKLISPETPPDMLHLEGMLTQHLVISGLSQIPQGTYTFQVTITNLCVRFGFCEKGVSTTTIELYAGIDVGIDLGTYKSCIAFADSSSESHIIISDPTYKRNCISSYVYFPESLDDLVLVGYAAEIKSKTYPDRTIFDAKRILGTTFRDPAIASLVSRFPFKVVNDSFLPKISLPTPHGMVSPSLVSAIVLSHLRDIASKELGYDVTRAVITTPAYFNNLQRQETYDAAHMAGLQVLKLIPEPTAAMFAHGYNSTKEGIYLVVFDFGGGTLDVSVIYKNGDFVQIINVVGDTLLGGQDFRERMKLLMIKKIKQSSYRGNLELTPTFNQQLYFAAEDAKIHLSSYPVTQVDLSYGDDLMMRIEITRAEFVKEIEDLVDKAVALAVKAVEDVHLKPNNIDAVLMVGGSSKLPSVEERLKLRFQKAEFPTSQYDRILLVAAGASLVAANQANAVLDIIPRSIGIKVCNKLTHKPEIKQIFAKNLPYPTQITETFTNVVPKQTHVVFSVYEGESTDPSENLFLASFNISDLPPTTRENEIIFSVTFTIDKDGVLNVAATLISGDVNQKVQNIKLPVCANSGRLSKGEVTYARAQIQKWTGKVPKDMEITPPFKEDKEGSPYQDSFICAPPPRTLTHDYLFIDNSGSMNGLGRIELARTLVKKMEKRYTASQKSKVVLFGTFYKVLLNFGDTFDAGLITSEITGTMGQTKLWQVVYEMLINHGSDDTQRVGVTVITDGNDNLSNVPFNGVHGFIPMLTEVTEKFGSSPVQMNIVILGDAFTPQEVKEYNELCKVTGGSFLAILHPEQMNDHDWENTLGFMDSFLVNGIQSQPLGGY